MGGIGNELRANVILNPLELQPNIPLDTGGKARGFSRFLPPGVGESNRGVVQFYRILQTLFSPFNGNDPEGKVTLKKCGNIGSRKPLPIIDRLSLSSICQDCPAKVQMPNPDCFDRWFYPGGTVLSNFS